MDQPGIIRELDLPPAPPGWQTLGWQGIVLTVPAGWNLTHHRGDRRAGLLALADLRKMQLEIRWQKYRPAAVARHSAKFRRQLEKRGARVSRLEHALPAWRVEHERTTVVLVEGHRRFYELSWPGKPTHLPEIMAGFRDETREPTWAWRVYGAAARVDARYRMKKALLLPGAVRMLFVFRARRVQAGSWSLADRLLAGRPIPDWAKAQVKAVKNNPGGSWDLQGPRAVFRYQTRSLLLRRKQEHVLVIRHVAEANTLEWIAGRARDVVV